MAFPPDPNQQFTNDDRRVGWSRHAGNMHRKPGTLTFDTPRHAVPARAAESDPDLEMIQTGVDYFDGALQDLLQRFEGGFQNRGIAQDVIDAAVQSFRQMVHQANTLRAVGATIQADGTYTATVNGMQLYPRTAN